MNDADEFVYSFKSVCVGGVYGVGGVWGGGLWGAASRKKRRGKKKREVANKFIRKIMYVPFFLHTCLLSHTFILTE